MNCKLNENESPFSPNKETNRNQKRKFIKLQFKTFIETNDISKLNELLDERSNFLLLQREKYLDPYVIAVRSNNLDIFDYLSRKGFKLADKNESELLINKKRKLSDEDDEYDQETQLNSSKLCESNASLIEAIKCENIEAVRKLIILGVNLNSFDYKSVPLQTAYNVYSNEREKFFYKQNQTRLEKSLKIFELLLNNHANPNIYNNKGYRLIHQITLDKDLDMLQLLISRSGTSLKMNALTFGKMQNALHLVSESKKFKYNLQSHHRNESSSRSSINEREKQHELNVKLAKFLIDSGCDMNHADKEYQETPVYKAILANNFALVKLFICEGSDMSIRNVFGNDVLSRSIQLGRFKIARLLIAADSPIRVYSCFYKIPSIDEYKRFNNEELMSVQYGDDETEQYNIDSNEYNSNRDNFLQYSIGKYEEFLEFLKKYTQQPRRLVDLSRLCVRNHMKKPISKYVNHLGSLPPRIVNLVMLNDIEEMI